jgi:endogenous inhibitor of DNA gyrase (YacG/DUF329 family)
MSKPPITVPCPTCGKLVPWVAEQRYRPFCSDRCRLIDLGEWFEERHRIAGEERPADSEEDERG